MGYRPPKWSGLLSALPSVWAPASPSLFLLQSTLIPDQGQGSPLLFIHTLAGCMGCWEVQG